MDKVEEPAREGFLYQLWLERGFGSQSLRTVDGRTVEIREKGVRNYDAGPDFLDALIVVGGQMQRGDIEIHPVAGDWFLHGHHRDPRYNNVVLHVVTMDCPPNFRTLRQDGTLVPTLNLDAFLEMPADQLQETDLAPEVVATGSTQCELAKKPDEIMQRILEWAGDERLAAKAQRFAERRQTDSYDQIFVEGIFEALGYSKNQVPFRNLARNLPVATLSKYLWNDPPDLALKKCQAYLLGAAGLLPSQSAGFKSVTDPEVQDYVIEVEQYWLDFPERRKLEILKPEAWQFFRLRPQNFPTRRIAGAAVILLRFMEEGFVSALRKAIANGERQPEAAGREMEKLFSVKAQGFWGKHFCFDESNLERGQRARAELHLVGPDRAKDIVVNVAIPALLAYAGETDDGRLRNLLREIYAHYPLISENEISRAVRKQLFGSEKGGIQCVTGVRHQQGMIHLKKSVCQRGPCAQCLQMSQAWSST